MSNAVHSKDSVTFNLVLTVTIPFGEERSLLLISALDFSRIEPLSEFLSHSASPLILFYFHSTVIWFFSLVTVVTNKVASREAKASNLVITFGK